jgi:peptidoglycan/LPS O-acetylase OafA/YrhL
MSVVAFHVRAICSYHLRASPLGLAVEGDLVNAVFGTGHLGVKLFFAISGFILSLPFARQHLCAGKRIRLRDYYIRRVTRIEPPYIIHLMFLFLACGLVLRWLPSHPHLYHNPAWAGYALKHIVSSLFYANGFIFTSHPYPNIVLWSLETEVQFYILAPFLAGIFLVATPWKRRTFIVVSILAGYLIRAGLGDANSYRINFSLLGNYQYFFAGFLLADFYLLNRIESAARNYKWDLVFPLAIASVVLLSHHPQLEVLLPWLILVCCLAAFRGVLTAQFLGHPWIATIGGMCYTIYMYHWLMISLLIRLTIRLQTHVLWLDLLIQFAVMSVIIIGVCAVLFAVFERPFMQRDWPQKLWNKIRRPGTEP